ncbi:multidrug transporter subunit MdtD [Pseudomonas sp.]|uniref:multidrug transporter subunit MdtD n=1 Tax=Pseudomonas sp. TaxID=306 RepID=UPI003FD88867
MTIQAVLDPRTARLLPWLVAVAFFMQTLDGTILNTALPAMAIDLGESPLRMHGVLIAYLITVATLIPASGWLADRFGTRRTFYTAIMLFCSGSLLCTQVNTLDSLIIARVIQALGGALMMPVGRLVVLRAYPRSDLVRVMSFVTFPGLVGQLMGPTLGGWLVEYASWRWIFAINLPIGLLGAYAAHQLMPDFRPAIRTRFDVVGFGLFGAFTLSIILGLQSLSQDSLQDSGGFFGIAVSALVLYWLHASRSQYPLFALSLFRLRSFSVGIIGSLMSRLGSGAMPFLTPLMMQVGLGHSPSIAGMSMIPLTVSGMATKPFIGAVIRRFGYRAVLGCNTLAQGVLICSMALVEAKTPLWLIIPLLSLIGVANYVQFTAMGTVTLIELNDHQASAGTSLMSVTTQLSTGLAVSAAGALLVLFNPNEAVLRLSGVMDVFSKVYLSLGALTIVSALLFLRLPRKD